jgi:hypothetical protein
MNAKHCEEREQWREASRQHAHAIEALFAQIHRKIKSCSFATIPPPCPFCETCPHCKCALHQIERTIIGHLHSELILKQSRLLSWLPHHHRLRNNHRSNLLSSFESQRVASF